MKIIPAFRYACSGLRQAIKTQQNFRIELTGACMATLAGLIFKISATEWLIIILCICFVLSLELLNTAVEKYCDLFTNEFHPQIKFIKDISAAAVLMAALGAVFSGLIIFVPKVFQLINFTIR